MITFNSTAYTVPFCLLIDILLGFMRNFAAGDDEYIYDISDVCMIDESDMRMDER